VECWLLDVQAAMKRTMHSITREALAAYPKAPRTSWILQWPGQLVLNGSQVRRTAAAQHMLVRIGNGKFINTPVPATIVPLFYRA
jgi:dynein heavy chain